MNYLEKIISDFAMGNESPCCDMIEDFLSTKLPEEYYYRSFKAEAYNLSHRRGDEIFICSHECGMLHISQLEKLSDSLVCPECGRSICLADHWESAHGFPLCPKCFIKNMKQRCPGFVHVAKHVEDIRDLAVGAYGWAVIEIKNNGLWMVDFDRYRIRIYLQSEPEVSLITIPRVRPVSYLTHRETIQRCTKLLSKFSAGAFKISELHIPSEPITEESKQLEFARHSRPAFYYNQGKIYAGGMGMSDSKIIRDTLKSIPKEIAGQPIKETTIERMELPVELLDFISKHKKMLLKKLKIDGSIILENNKTNTRSVIYPRKTHLIHSTMELSMIPEPSQDVSVARY